MRKMMDGLQRRRKSAARCSCGQDDEPYYSTTLAAPDGVPPGKRKIFDEMWKSAGKQTVWMNPQWKKPKGRLPHPGARPHSAVVSLRVEPAGLLPGARPSWALAGAMGDRLKPRRSSSRGPGVQLEFEAGIGSKVAYLPAA